MPKNTVNILFVDDEVNVLSGIRRMLHKVTSGWTIHTAESVDFAIACIRNNDIDIVVSDFNMPQKDGLELIRTLKSTTEFEDIPVIMLTGNAEVDLKRRALDAGAIDLLSKPVVQEDLIARLRSVLQLRSYQKQLVESNEHLEQRVLERTEELARSRNELLWRLAYAVEARDDETGAHIARVARFTREIAIAMELPADQVESMYVASPLHDIGKIAVPDSILHKPGRLSDDERSEVQKHCRTGWDILMRKATIEDSVTDQNPLLECAAQIALHHHEKWDGTGYPQGLQGESIPLAGRIVAAADVLDALCTKRSYKDPIPFEDSFKAIQEMSGTHFDPDVIHACTLCRDKLKNIASEQQDQSDTLDQTQGVAA